MINGNRPKNVWVFLDRKNRTDGGRGQRVYKFGKRNLSIGKEKCPEKIRSQNASRG